MSARSPFWTAQNAAALLADPQWLSPEGSLAFTPLASLETADARGSLSQALTAGEFIDFITLDLTAGNSYRFVGSGAAATDLAVFDADGFMLVVNPAASSGDISFTASYTGRHVLGLRFRQDQLGAWTLQGTEDIGADGRNNAPAIVSIAAADADKAEGQAGTTAFTFTVTRSGPTAGAGSVAWTVEKGGTSLSDFGGGVLPSGVVSFAAGETAKAVTVLVAGDRAREADEAFTVRLSAPSAGLNLGTATATGTIRNDDALISIGPATVTAPEGQAGTTTFTFTVTRQQGLDAAHSVGWAVAPLVVGTDRASAAAASDFVGGVLPTGVVTFAPGETARTITVEVVGDTTPERDENFTVGLRNPGAGVTLGTAKAKGVIRSDDTTLSVAGPAAPVGEGQAGTTSVTFTVTRAGNADKVASVQWKVAGAGGAPADAKDFAGGVLPSGTLSFAAGETSKTIAIAVQGDRLVEADEGFTVTLSRPSAGLLLGAASASATIRNDDLGTAVGDTLLGGAGGDTLLGLGGADSLVGGDGNDRLDGGTGPDTLAGGRGDDTFLLDSTGDRAVEAAGAGIDLVLAAVSATLGGNLEQLRLTGTAALAGTGNDLANQITGNTAANRLKGLGGNDTLSGAEGNDTLDGGTGADSLVGGAGNDRYLVGEATDLVLERAGEGADTVIAALDWTLGEHLEALQLGGSSGLAGAGNQLGNLILGNGGNNRLSGLDGSDTLRGGSGADTLLGGAGNDSLDGGTGADRFVFAEPGQGSDTVTGFTPGTDLIVLDASAFGGGLAAGAAPTFIANFTGRSTTAAGVGQVIYETDSGRLWWDADGGGGAATLVATLSGKPALSASDLLVIA